MTTTNIKFFVNTPHSYSIMTRRVALNTLEMVSHHQRVAMNAHELLSELSFQVSQRVINKYLSAFMTYGDILVVSLKKSYFRKGY